MTLVLTEAILHNIEDHKFKKVWTTHHNQQRRQKTLNRQGSLNLPQNFVRRELLSYSVQSTGVCTVCEMRIFPQSKNDHKPLAVSVAVSCGMKESPQLVDSSN